MKAVQSASAGLAATFAAMSIAELVIAKTDMAKTLDEKIAAERAELTARFDTLNEAAGTPVAPVKRQYNKRNATPGAPGANSKVHALKGKSVPAKYRGPQGETWSGRGLAPRWLTALEQSGKKRDKYLIR